MWDGTVYGNPAKFGLEMLGEVEWNDYGYEFDMTAVWKKSRGEYYMANDSGCSCPMPFERFNKLEDLDGPYTKSALKFNLYKKLNEENHGRAYTGLKKDIDAILERIK